MVAGDREAGPGRQVGGQLLTPTGEVGEDQDALAGGEHGVDDLVEAGQLAGPPVEILAVPVEVGGGMVADLLQGGDGGQHLALAGGAVVRQLVAEQPVDDGLVQADLLGGHAAVVELVDLVGQLGGDQRLGLGAAEDEQTVEGPQGRLARPLAVVALGQPFDEGVSAGRPGPGW